MSHADPPRPSPSPAPGALPSSAVVRALASAARPAPASGETGDEGSPELAPPERVLGSLLAPLGSVELAHRLAERPTGDGAHGGDHTGALGSALRERTRRRLDELRGAADEPLRAPFEGRGRLAGPDLVHARLEELCADVCAELGDERASPAASPAEIAEAARDLAGPFHDRVGLAVRRARGIVAGVRLRIRDEVRGLGQEAAHLEELDALVANHTAAKTSALFDRIPTILMEHFERQLMAAVQAAPTPPPREYTEGFFADGGWIAAHIARCRDTVTGVFEHERRALWGFVTAVSEVEKP
jgi:hypothetical protein